MIRHEYHSRTTFLCTSDDPTSKDQATLVRRPPTKSRQSNPDVLREYHGEICDVLNVSKDSLLSFTQKLFAVNIINRDTKISVTRIEGEEGADTLLDHIEIKVEQNPDCLQVVLELMENDEYLRHIVKKIKDEYEGEEIVISLTLNTLQSLIHVYVTVKKKSSY